MKTGVRRTFLLSILVIALSTLASCCHPLPQTAAGNRPRLVVVVSVDQLTYDYLDRFQANFSERGLFGRCLKNGAWFSECHHRHSFTLTGPGHSVMMTGTYPNATGIIDNHWYDRSRAGQKSPIVYCVEDPSQPIVGAPAGKTELKGVSPKNLLVPTVGDELKKETGGKAKVFGVTLKDRAAVLMTGHKTDMAIWFDPNTGNWVTSRYYRAALPAWLATINDSDLAKSYAGKLWELLYDESKYRLNYPDDSPFEGNPEELGKAFPHKLDAKVASRYYKQLAVSPFGNEMTVKVAEQMVIAEKLGQDDVPDILCLGLSSNDYVGHNYGPHSLEVEDMTYRTDLLLGQFTDFLDEKVGKGKWVLALSADHAVGPVPEYAATIGLPSKRNALDTNKLEKELEKALVEKFGEPKGKSFVEKVDGQQVYLRRPESADDRRPISEMEVLVKEIVAAHPAIGAVYTRDELLASAPKEYSLINQFRRSCNPERSGDVLYAQKEFHILGKLTATHGSPWRYDTHVPLLFYGAGIHPGKFDTQVSPAMIAPTISKILKISPPSGNVETPANEALE